MTEIGFKLPVVGVWSLCIRRLKKKKTTNVRYYNIFISQVIRKQLDTDIKVDLSILKIPT